jgi:hypothetical protein
MNEHRIAPRHRILKAGTISFGGAAIDCTVRNISDTGAALDVVTPLFIPDRFTLIVQSAQTSQPCTSSGARNGEWAWRSIEIFLAPRREHLPRPFTLIVACVLASGTSDLIAGATTAQKPSRRP